MKLHGCGDCTYFNTGTGATGACHRYPPTSDLHWPRVSWDDWCGELVPLVKDQPSVVAQAELPDHLKAIIDRAKAHVSGSTLQPVAVPTTKCLECNGTGKVWHPTATCQVECPVCYGLGLARKGDAA